LEKKHLLNYQIKSEKVVLLDQDGHKSGEMSSREALRKASEQNLDLIQVGVNNNIAICKILNYESWLYHENKKKQKQEFKNRSHEIKTMPFRPVIGEHDLQLKLKKVIEFLNSQHKVKISVKFNSFRESSMRELNEEFVKKIIDYLENYGALDSKINYAPKEISFIIKPQQKKHVLKPN
jgi:translation initiation factor IF-3